MGRRIAHLAASAAASTLVAAFVSPVILLLAETPGSAAPSQPKDLFKHVQFKQ